MIAASQSLCSWPCSARGMASATPATAGACQATRSRTYACKSARTRNENSDSQSPTADCQPLIAQVHVRLVRHRVRTAQGRPS